MFTCKSVSQPLVPRSAILCFICTLLLVAAMAPGVQGSASCRSTYPLRLQDRGDALRNVNQSLINFKIQVTNKEIWFNKSGKT